MTTNAPVSSLSEASPSPRRVAVPGGRIAYASHGAPGGRTLVLIPGLGDTSAQYRELLPRLLARGFRVLALDLRGHGASDATFPSYTVEDLAGDVLAVMDDAGVERAILVGASIGASAAVLAAHRRPERVEGLVLAGPFVRDTPADRYVRPMMRVLFAKAWGAWAWSAYYGSLFKRRPPADLAAHRRFLRAHFREPGRLDALVRMVCSSKDAAEAALGQVRAPALVLMGTKDPDFPNPTAEAERVRAGLGGPATVHLVDGVGHYPHLEVPDEMAERLDAWLTEAARAPRAA